MKKYYYNSYRGFSNEFSVISVDQSNQYELERFAKFEKQYLNSQNVNWDLHRVTARCAREIVAAERRTARSYIRAGLNLHCNPVGATEIITATEFFSEY